MSRSPRPPEKEVKGEETEDEISCPIGTDSVVGSLMIQMPPIPHSLPPDIHNQTVPALAIFLPLDKMSYIYSPDSCLIWSSGEESY